MLRGEFLMTGTGPAVIGQSILSSHANEVEELETLQ